MKGGEVSISIPHPLSSFGEALALSAQYQYLHCRLLRSYTSLEPQFVILFTFKSCSNVDHVEHHSKIKILTQKGIGQKQSTRRPEAASQSRPLPGSPSETPRGAAGNNDAAGKGSSTSLSTAIVRPRMPCRRIKLAAPT